MSDRFRRWWANNWASLIISIGLAIAIWVVATEDADSIEVRTLPSRVPISGVEAPAGLIIVNEPTSTTEITLRAQESTWQSLSAEDILATIDLTGFEPGVHQVPVTVEILGQGSRRVAVVAWNPTQVRVVLEQEETREVPIQVGLQGQPPLGFTLGEYSTDPPSVTLQGPQSLVELVSEVRGEVNVDDVRSEVREEIQLVALDSEGNPVEDVAITPNRAVVTVPITQDARFKVISIVPSPIGRVEDGYRLVQIEADPASVTVQGDPDVIDRLEGSIRLTVDISGLSDTIFFTNTISLPPGVTPIETETVRIRVQVEPQIASQSINIPIEVVNLAEGFEAIISPEQLEIIIEGPVPTLDDFNPETDIRAFIDLTDFPVGTATITPEVEVLLDDLSIISIFPVDIEVEILETTDETSQ
ncbi:MAG: hypothetical protein GYB68_15805 [Chloroflexi bacterium]|nr:hypothetical protein [Chloroflexota bacterium]